MMSVDMCIRLLLQLSVMWNMVQTDHDDLEKAEAMNSMAGLKYTIDHTWDGLPLAHEPIKVSFRIFIHLDSRKLRFIANFL